MDYFAAVQEGKGRVKKAMEILQEASGPALPVLFLKMGIQEWTPVGDECLVALVKGKGSTSSVVICDQDGNAKAMSNWISQAEADRTAKALESKGVERYEGEVKLPI